MEGDEVLDQGIIVVDCAQVAAVGEEVYVPEDALVIDVEGKTMIPGIVDAHAHANHFVSGPLPEQNRGYYDNLASGMTTAHNPSANTGTVFTLR